MKNTFQKVLIIFLLSSFSLSAASAGAGGPGRSEALAQLKLILNQLSTDIDTKKAYIAGLSASMQELSRRSGNYKRKKKNLNVAQAELDSLINQIGTIYQMFNSRMEALTADEDPS